MATDTHTEFRVRRMKRDEIALVREWSFGEGWNPGLHDIGCFCATDPNGFFLGELGREPIACVSCITYDDTFGFLGHYIVRPGFRGHGYGIQVWRAGMSHLGDRNVGLDGVVAQQENYRKSGFQYAHSHVRYRGAGGGTRCKDVVPLTDLSFDDLAAYDRRHVPADRRGFLRCWVNLPGTTTLGCVKDGQLVGYGTIRPAAEGSRVGPLFADEPGIADALFRSLLATAPGQSVFIDTTDESANPHIPAFVERFALSELFRTARMYNKVTPRLPLANVYAVMSLEAG